MTDHPRCPVEDHLPTALRLAEAARSVVRVYFRNRLVVEDKQDASPVTIADRKAEQAMRAILAQERPDHGIWGEEYGHEREQAEWVWVLDPIDGTKSFICGIPVFGTLIALLHRGKPVLGIIDQAISGERWIGMSGHPTTLNGAAIATRPCAALSDAYLFATAPEIFTTAADQAGWRALAAGVKQSRYGIDCYAYGLLAAGYIDLVAEADLKPHDMMALIPIIEGAGGIITDWRGQDLSVDSDGHVLAAGDHDLHRQALACLAACAG